MKLTAFPESFLSKMSPEDRRAIGQPTMAEAEAQYQRGQERELKRDVLNWLNLQGCYVFTQGMHTRTGGRCGAPDILACVPPEGRFLAIELQGSRRSARARTGHGDREDPCGGGLRDSGLLPA
jgi:hypothetical protein